MSLSNLLNFDIIIVIVIFGFIIYAIYFRTRSQICFTSTLLLSLLVLHFLQEPLIKVVDRSGILNFIAKILPFTNKQLYPAIIFVLGITLILLITVFRFTFLLLQEPIEKQAKNKEKAWHKIINIGLSLINSYIFIVFIIFISQPVINIDYSRPLSKIILKTTPSEFVLPYINEMNHKAYNYILYKDAFKHIEGEHAKETYEELKESINKYQQLNDYFSSNIYGYLSNDAQILLSEAVLNNNYLAILLEDAGGRVLDRIIIIETANSVIDELLVFREAIDKDQGNCLVYIDLRSQGINEDDFFAVGNYLVNNESNLIQYFNNYQSKKVFLETINNFKFILDNYQIIIDSSVETLDEYRYNIQLIIENQDLLFACGDRFVNSKLDNETSITKSVKAMFKTLLKYENNFKTDIPTPLYLALASNYKFWFESELLFKNMIYKIYISEVITNPQYPAHHLYNHYFFYHYLDLENIITAEELLAELETINKQGTLTEDQISMYLTSLFIVPNNLINDLRKEQRLNENFFNDIKNSSHRFVSAELKEYLS